MRRKTSLKHSQQGFTLAETMVVTLLISAVIGMSLSLFLSGAGLCMTNEVKIQMQENLRLVFQRVSLELRQTNLAQLNIADGTGTNNSDEIRFSLPVLCQSDSKLLDDLGNVAHWGAPLTWGCTQSSCMDEDDSCATVEYKFLEFRLDDQGQLVRSVLDDALDVKRTDVLAHHIIDFQTALNGSIVTLTVTTQATAGNGRVLTAQASEDVYLRN